MRTLDTVEAIVEELGGTGAVAVLTARGPSAVSNWKTARRFSSETYLIIQDALLSKQCRAPASLWGIKEPERAA